MTSDARTSRYRNNSKLNPLTAHLTSDVLIGQEPHVHSTIDALYGKKTGTCFGTQ